MSEKVGGGGVVTDEYDLRFDHCAHVQSLVGARVDDPKQEREIHNHVERRRRWRAISANSANSARNSPDDSVGQNFCAGFIDLHRRAFLHASQLATDWSNQGNERAHARKGQGQAHLLKCIHRI